MKDWGRIYSLYIQLTYPDTGLEKFAYTASDLLTLTDAKNQVTTWNYSGSAGHGVSPLRS